MFLWHSGNDVLERPVIRALCLTSFLVRFKLYILREPLIVNFSIIFRKRNSNIVLYFLVIIRNIHEKYSQCRPIQFNFITLYYQLGINVWVIFVNNYCHYYYLFNWKKGTRIQFKQRYFHSCYFQILVQKWYYFLKYF